ncbi:MAG: hypothetical protein BGO83_23505 [Devosia sp. 66-14]|jgi:hypothetical protein|nr:MAG: hypothetical protein ABS47_11710 [Devosia sp. SCN 66-27]OJX26810.1 MAG: hypothetical protein BGO83_23505 [Devosia sp. 66-14]
MRTQSPTSNRSRRLNLGLSERDAIRLADLGALTNASSQTEVIKRALLTYEALVERLADGAEFFVQDAEDETPVPLNLLIDVEPRQRLPRLGIVASSEQADPPASGQRRQGRNGR